METNKITKGIWTAHKISDGYVIKEAGLFEKGFSDRIAELYQYDSEANAHHIVRCVNGYDTLLEENNRLKEALEGIGNVLDFCINATPTGAVRNLLTDANIIAKTVLDLSTVKEVGDNG